MDYDGYLVAFPLGKVLNNYSGECVANIANYLDFNNLHAFIAYADAKDWANAPVMRGAFDWIVNNPNDPNQIPKRGDIPVWGGDLPGSGGSGHIGIFDGIVGPGIFRSYDNNWGGRYLHFVNHNWNYILGWWTPKVSAPAPQPSGGGQIMDSRDKVIRQYETLRYPNPVTEAELQSWLNGSYDAFNQKARPELESRAQAQKDTQAQIANLSALNNQLNQTLTDITNQSNATKAEKDAALAKAAELQTQLTEAMDKLKEAQNQPQVPVQPPVDDESVGAFKQVVAFIKKLLGIKEN